MFCHMCGKKLPDNAKFCIYCGEKIDFQDKQTAKRTPKHKPLCIAAIIGVILVAITGAAFIFKPWEQKTTGQEQAVVESDSSIASAEPIDDMSVTDENNGFSPQVEAAKSTIVNGFYDEEIIQEYFATIDPESTIEETPWDDIRESLVPSHNPTGYWYYLLDDGTAVIEECRRTEEVIVLPETLDSHPVSKLRGGSVFAYASLIKTVIIPDCILSVVEGTFNNRPSLTSIEVSDSHPTMTSLDGVLFSKGGGMLLAYPQSKGDTEYFVPEGTRKIGRRAFSAHFNTPSVQKVVLPDSVESIGRFAFYSCVSLKEIKIPSGIRYIGESAFKACESLQTKIPQVS